MHLYSSRCVGIIVSFSYMTRTTPMQAIVLMMPVGLHLSNMIPRDRSLETARPGAKRSFWNQSYLTGMAGRILPVTIHTPSLNPLYLLHTHKAGCMCVCGRGVGERRKKSPNSAPPPPTLPPPATLPPSVSALLLHTEEAGPYSSWWCQITTRLDAGL